MNPSRRQLEVFVWTYRLRSLTKAASQLGLTQSAISVSIRQLEDTVGLKLFDRTTRFIRPTAGANDLLPQVERILRDFESLARRAKSFSGRAHGQFAFSVNAAVAFAIMPRLLASFKNANPNIKVTIFDVDPLQLVQKVVDEEVELSVGTANAPHDEIVEIPLARDRLSVICQQTSPLARNDTLPWSVILEHPTIVTPRGTITRTLIDEVMLRKRKVFEPTYEVTYLSTALSMTSHGIAVAILPSYLVAHTHFPNLTSVPLSSPSIWRCLSVIVKRDRTLSPAAGAFVEIAKQVFAEGTQSVVKR